VRAGVAALTVVALLGAGVAAMPAGAAPRKALAWAHWPTIYRERTGAVRTVAAGIVEYSDRITASDGSYSGWIVRVDLRDRGISLHVVAADNHVMSGDEVLSSMARDTKADVAVNGDFFQIYATGNPDNEEIVNGTVLQSQQPTGPGYSELMVGTHEHVTIGQASFRGSVTAGGDVEPLSGVNTLYGAGWTGPGALAGTEPVLVTGALGASVDVGDGAVAATLAPDGHDWKVRQVIRTSTVRPPTAPLVRLVGLHGAGRWITAHLTAGQVVTLRTAVGPHPTVQALGGGPVLVRNGRYVDLSTDSSYPEAKSGAYLDRSGRYLFLVCFQQSWTDRGMTRHQFAGWMAAHGAWTGMMFDDGGSAELIARLGGRQKILNAPSDGQERRIADALVVRG
jgi:hypothetical protein